jgi:hypothetical protein
MFADMFVCLLLIKCNSNTEREGAETVLNTVFDLSFKHCFLERNFYAGFYQIFQIISLSFIQMLRKFYAARLMSLTVWELDFLQLSHPSDLKLVAEIIYHKIV